MKKDKDMKKKSKEGQIENRQSPQAENRDKFPSEDARNIRQEG